MDTTQLSSYDAGVWQAGYKTGWAGTPASSCLWDPDAKEYHVWMDGWRAGDSDWSKQPYDGGELGETAQGFASPLAAGNGGGSPVKTSEDVPTAARVVGKGGRQKASADAATGPLPPAIETADQLIEAQKGCASCDDPVSMARSYNEELRRRLDYDGRMRVRRPVELPLIVRQFDTGATRDTDNGKPQYAGFLSPLVLRRFGEYMNRHRIQSDGQPRAAENWKKGMPRREYLESHIRHLMDAWLILEGSPELAREDLEEALCGMFFNTQGLLHEVLLGRDVPTQAA